ncbi:MAG: M20 family metallopeptidase, partial [Anaerolineales bacterium]
MTNLQDVLSFINPDEIAKICQDLIRIDTTNPPGNERAAAQYLCNTLKSVGFEDKWIDHDAQRATLIARLPGNGGRAALVFNGHTDVVPVGKSDWLYPPFAGAIEDGKVWGRGASDMKGGLAAMVIAAKAIAKSGIRLKGDLILTATAGEEVNMLGAQSLAALPEAKHWQAVVISEPTSNQLGLAERGVLWVEFTTHGKTAHGSTPELGKNAITMMIQLLNEFEKLEIPFQPHPILGNFTQSINMI